MVFPPSRRLPESKLRPDQIVGGRREPQVDLAELSVQVHPDAFTGTPRIPVRPLGGATRDFTPRGKPPGPSADAGDNDIPTLTEVVQVQSVDTAGLVPPRGDVDQQQTEEVLQRLLRRSDMLLEAPLQHALMPVMERLAGIVARELHDSLERIVREVVARAVTEELTRLHGETDERDRSSGRT
jgi:hypothetical protein